MRPSSFIPPMLLLSVFVFFVLLRGCEREPEEYRVHVFLYNAQMESAYNPLGLAPVQRTASPESPAEDALKHLLDGPTVTDRQLGFRGVEGEDLHLESLAIDGDTARVELESRSGKSWQGTLSAPRFRHAVERTLLQFPEVRQVEIRVDGATDFDSEKG